MFSVPLPSILKECAIVLTAEEEDNATSNGVKYHRHIRTRWRSDILFLRLQKVRHRAEPNLSGFPAQAVFRNPHLRGPEKKALRLENASASVALGFFTDRRTSASQSRFVFNQRGGDL